MWIFVIESNMIFLRFQKAKDRVKGTELLQITNRHGTYSPAAVFEDRIYSTVTYSPASRRMSQNLEMGHAHLAHGNHPAYADCG
jgi:hypothetical protein